MRLTDGDYRALSEFRRAIRQFLSFSAAGAADRGLTSQQHQALLSIRAHVGQEPMSISELASELSIKNHSALGLADRLIDGGFAQRATSTSDKRRVLLVLTVQGAKVLEEISRRNLEQLGEASQILEGLIRTTRVLGEPPGSTFRSDESPRS